MTAIAEDAVTARTAQRSWAERPIRDRLRCVAAFREGLVGAIDRLTAAVQADVGRSPDEVIGSDLLPVASTCRYLVRSAARVLASRRVSGTPMWLMGCRDVVHRRPHGVVGLIGTWNYPIYLNAIPILHALTAGNAVLWKPSELAARSSAILHELFLQAGVPSEVLRLLPATREIGPALAEADIDFLHFTGSDKVGRQIARRLGERLIPSTLELSGIDAVVVLADADLDLAARSIWYAVTLNAGQTCMATRRVYVARSVMPGLLERLAPYWQRGEPRSLVMPAQVEQAQRLVSDARDRGAKVYPEVTTPPESGFVPTILVSEQDDIAACQEVSFAPLSTVIPFDDVNDMVDRHNRNPFGLTTAIFTKDTSAGEALAGRIRAGAVVINDVIVPTAHPGSPFGGRGASGWGVTKGDEGLIGMTVPQVVTRRGGRFRPHLDLLDHPEKAGTTRGVFLLAHGRTLRERWQGLRLMMK